MDQNWCKHRNMFGLAQLIFSYKGSPQDHKKF